MKKLFFLAVLCLMAMQAHAQWRIGANAGATYNHFTVDKHYLIDFNYKDRWGTQLGLMGQYDVNDWLGIRAELNLMQKNHTVERTQVPMKHQYTNNYLTLPVMASFSFGGENLRGFCNLGVYGGYWLSCHNEGSDYNSFSEHEYSINEDVDFNSKRDQRWDCGFVGGVGLEYHFVEHWRVQAEARYYYSTTSVQKDYMKVKDPKYNSTLALQAGVIYFF